MRANLAWYTVPRLLSRGSALLLLPVYTRVLSPADLGAAMVVLAVGGVLSLVVAPGIDAVYFRWVHQPSASADERTGRTGTVAAAHFGMLVLTVGALAGGAGTISAWLLPGIPAWPLFHLILATAVLGSIAVPRQTAWRAEGRAERFAAFEMVYSATAIAVTLMALFVGRLGALSLVLGNFVAWVVLLPWYAGQFIRDLRRGWDVSLVSSMVPLVLVGLPLALSSWALSALDRIFLNRLAGTLEVGLFSAAAQVGSGITLFAIILNKEWQPTIFNLLRNGKDGEIEALRRLWTGSFSVFLAFGSVLAVIARLVVDVVLGEEFVASATIVPLIVLAAVLRVPRVFMVNVGLASGRTRDVAIESVLSVAVFIVANLALIPSFGILGAALAGVLAHGAGVLFLFSRRWNVLGVNRHMGIWGVVLISSVVLGNVAGDGGFVKLAGMVVGAFFVREVAAYWLVLGALSQYKSVR